MIVCAVHLSPSRGGANDDITEHKRIESERAAEALAAVSERGRRRRFLSLLSSPSTARYIRRWSMAAAAAAVRPQRRPCWGRNIGEGAGEGGVQTIATLQLVRLPSSQLF